MFYNQLENLCKKNGLTVTAFLKQINLSPSKGTAWKGGSIPKYDTLKLIADYFNVTISYLFEDTGDNNKGNNVGYSIESQSAKIDGLAKEMLYKFENLEFCDKVKVMSLIAELSEEKGA
ncbi:MAG: helix-turn-helix domain-containing protein [Ruminococcus sp.]|nr:helix-turn-helix domain-containing protein [Ruminococcus sp.]